MYLRKTTKDGKRDTRCDASHQQGDAQRRAHAKEEKGVERWSNMLRMGHPQALTPLSLSLSLVLSI